MKKLYLIANSHIDPIWQWDWQEGAAATISTFKSAADLLEEYDFVFCHNEVLVYKYIEEYAPELFERIKSLVKRGKWKIMGGWFLQPDCNLPSGESIVRQISAGRRYFKEKFGVEPTTAINFDPFGHTRGLVQILKKSGYDSYLVCRPLNSQCPTDDEAFNWIGFDDSSVKVARCFTYRTALGKAGESIKKCIAENSQREVWFALWGVGNHGGGPSRKDLDDIAKIISESDFEIKHSYPEEFFANIEPTVNFSRSLQHCQPGCYISMSALKRRHIALENQLYMAEKICSLAEISGAAEYPSKELEEAETDLLNAEFHDVLPGTSIKSGEENGLRFLQHGLLLAEKAFAKAFFALSASERVAKEGEYPIIVFNPHPYPVKEVIDCEFTLAEQNFSVEKSLISVYDGDRKLPVQTIRERSMLNCDWRKRILFEAELEPMKIKRFSAFADYVKQSERKFIDGGVRVENEIGSVTIGDNGFLTSYLINGKEYICGNAFEAFLYEDNVDPWAMGVEQLKRIGTNPVAIEKTDEKVSVFKNCTGVKLIEDGEICSVVQACFKAENVKIRTLYKIYKRDLTVDISLNVFFNDADKVLKLSIPTTLNDGAFIGQSAFGTDELDADGREVVAQRFVAVKGNEEDCLALYNNCVYGNSFKDGTVRVALLRGAGYCVHPVDDMPFISDSEYVDRIDQGEHLYEFRLKVAKVDMLECEAAIFNQKPYALNAFPIGAQRGTSDVEIKIDDNSINLVAFKKRYDGKGYTIRLMNNSKKTKTSTFTVGKASVTLVFGKYEVKTLRYVGGKLSEESGLLETT